MGERLEADIDPIIVEALRAARSAAAETAAATAAAAAAAEKGPSPGQPDDDIDALLQDEGAADAELLMEEYFTPALPPPLPPRPLQPSASQPSALMTPLASDAPQGGDTLPAASSSSVLPDPLHITMDPLDVRTPQPVEEDSV